MIAHGSAKAALNTFARYIAYEEGPHGITANVVAPGYVHTDASAAVDIGGVIALIGSENSGYATGIVVPVSSGITLAY